jgi:hypothetical protein
MVLLPVTPKIATRLNILFLPPLKGGVLCCCHGPQGLSQQSISLYSDSHYVEGVLRCIETAYINHTSSEELFNLFFWLCSLV